MRRSWKVRPHRWWLAAALLGSLLAGGLIARRGRAKSGRWRWYRFVYRAAYRLGLVVWQRQAPPADLVDLVEGSSPPAPGRALDIGCGTGTDSVYLAVHGWEVTGVDMVPKALAMARRRAADAGVAPRFVNGDATRMPAAGIGDGYTLLFDFGCFHTLPDDRREAYVQSVSAVAAPGATFLLCGFTRPPRAAPMRAGMSTGEVQERFGRTWELVDARRAFAGKVEVVGTRADELFELWSYRLRRLPEPALGAGDGNALASAYAEQGDLEPGDGGEDVEERPAHRGSRGS